MHRDIVEIKFRGNENSVLQMALDFATKWQVHHYGHPRSGNVPQNVQKPFLVCNGHPTSIFPDFYFRWFAGHENVRSFEKQLFQAATRIFGTILVRPPLFENIASKNLVKNNGKKFQACLFFYVLPWKNSLYKTATTDIQSGSKQPARRGHRPDGVNRLLRLPKMPSKAHPALFLAPFTWFFGLERNHIERVVLHTIWVSKNVFSSIQMS